MSTKGVSTVATEDSGKLVKHIDEAKDWLDKAKQEYTQANPVRGELILNLAQAEIKYAWELSHVRAVSQNNDQGKLRVLNLRAKLVLPIAATILVILAASLLWFTKGNVKPQTVALVKKTTAASESSGALTEPAAATPNLAADNQTNEKSLILAEAELDATPVIGKLAAGQKSVTEKQPLPEKQPTAEKQPGEENKLQSESKSIAQASLPGSSTSSGGSNRLTDTHKDLAYSNNQSNLQPVSQLAIDVDALAKEAAHSLRNGK
jgi:hypothetical protein